MSDGSTRILPTPSQPQRPRRAGRRALILLISLVVLLALAVAADRAAAAYAASQIATQIHKNGFPNRPQVSVRGFPFLTQVASRNLKDVHLSDSHVRQGPVILSLVADATGIRLDPGYRSGTISHVEGTGLISFSNLASIAGGGSGPGFKLAADGPDTIKITANLQVITASAIAQIQPAGPDTFRIHIISADGLPASLLGSAQNFKVQVPPLPLGLTIQSVSVTGQGVLIHASGTDIPFNR